MSGFIIKLLTCSWSDIDTAPAEKVGSHRSQRSEVVSISNHDNRSAASLRTQPRTSNHATNRYSEHKDHNSSGHHMIEGIFHYRHHSKKRHSRTNLPPAPTRASENNDVQMLGFEDYRIADDDIRTVASNQTYETCHENADRLPPVIDRPVYVDNVLGPGFN